MIPGFNETLRHEGATFHIQTEDLGRTKAVVVSHIFRGGQILHSARREYGDKLEHPQIERLVKKLLILQHRDMQRLILSGKLSSEDDASSSQEEPGRTRSAVPEDGWDFPEDVSPTPRRTRSGRVLSDTASAEPEPELADDDELLQVMEASRAAAQATEAAAQSALVQPDDVPGARLGEGPPLVGFPAATGFLADVISDRRLDLVIALELARLSEETSGAPSPRP